MSAKAARKVEQVEMAGLEMNEGDRINLYREESFAIMRAIAKELTYETCANELDAMFSRHGRPVSPSVLRAALNDIERNHFRFEWAIWFARKHKEMGDKFCEIGGHAKAKRTEGEINTAFRELVRSKLSLVEAEKLIRQAEGL